MAGLRAARLFLRASVGWSYGAYVFDACLRGHLNIEAASGSIEACHHRVPTLFGCAMVVPTAHVVVAEPPLCYGEQGRRIIGSLRFPNTGKVAGEKIRVKFHKFSCGLTLA